MTALFLASTFAQAKVIPGFVYSKELKGNDDRGSFDIQYVQISPKALPNDAIRRPINAELAKMAHDSICDADHDRKDNMESNQKTTVTIAEPRALALDISSDYYCGGAHPDGGIVSFLYDLSTGKKVTIESQMTDEKAFKALVVDKVLANIPSGDVGDCADMYTKEALTEAFFNYRAEDDGIVATQMYAHAMQACGFSTKIPAAELAPLLRGGSLLKKLFAK
jgi:hypothetical protein